MRYKKLAVLMGTIASATILVAYGCNNESTSPATSSDDNTKSISSPTAASDANGIYHLGISNQTSSSVTIAWTSTDSVDACVYYGLTTAFVDSINDYTVDDVHYMTITGLQPDTMYCYAVRSGAVIDNNEGAYFMFHTARIGAGVPYSIYGTIYLVDEVTPTERTLLMVSVRTSLSVSAPLSTLSLDSNGFWFLNLGNLKDSATLNVLGYAIGDTIILSAYGASDSTAFDTVVIDGVSPQDCGDLYLGVEQFICDCIPGDANGDGIIDDADKKYLSSYLRQYKIAPTPYPVCSGDANCDCVVDSKDVTYLRNYLKGGPAPCTCEEWHTLCGDLQ